MDLGNTISNLKNCYYELAATELVMNYYSLCEGAADDEMDEVYKKTVSDFSGYRQKIGRYFDVASDKSSQDKEKLLEEVIAVREELKNKVNSLILLGDKNLIDEYVTARKGKDAEQPEYGNDDDYAREILTAIFESNDNNIINENILSMIYELPIRMTKSRFFDILEDGFKKYIGSPADVLDKMIFLTESAAGLNASDENCKISEADSYDDDRIAAEIDYLTSLCELINCVYVMLIDCDEIDDSVKDRVLGYSVIVKNSMLIAEKGEGYKKAMEESLLLLETTEGIPENLLDKINSLSGKFENIVNSEKNVYDGEKKLFDRLDRLMSNSVFAELEAQDETAVTEEKVHDEYEKLCGKLKAAFENGERSRNRAVMAAVLKELPVFFNSRTEVMNYVRESLSACRDIYEKSIAISRLMAKLNG